MYTRAMLAPAIALFLSIAACSPGDVTGPANEEPEPPPLTNVLYDVTVTLKSLEALGDCDRNEVVFGVSVGGPGEFAYSIWVGADGEVVRRVETIAFGQRGTGTASKLIENFGRHTLNETAKFLRAAGQSFTLGLAGIEWDGVLLTVRDPLLDGDMRQRTISVEEIGSGMSLDLMVGDTSDCGLNLYYSVAAVAR